MYKLFEAQIQLIKHYSTHTINTLFTSPIYQNIQLFNHNVQSNQATKPST